jgi:voltage-gated potassium channel
MSEVVMGAVQPVTVVGQERGWRIDGRLTELVQGRSVYLLISMFFLLGMGAWLNERFPTLPVFQLLFTLVLLATIRGLSARRRQAWFGLFLVVPTIVSLWLSKLAPSTGVSQLALALLLGFLLYAAATILLYILREEIVTIDTLCAAFSVFLLIGFAWGCIYGLLYLESPAAFHLPDIQPGSLEFGITPGVPMGILIYYSFVTLTTVGYGDVLPIASLARSMAVVEAVTGHFYLTVLIARLVGLSIARGANRSGG